MKFNYFKRIQILGCYNSTPLKMNLVLEIRMTSTRRQGFSVFEFSFSSSCSSIVWIRILFYLAYLLILLQVTCQTNSKIPTGTPNNSQVSPITRPSFLYYHFSFLNIHLPTKPNKSLGHKVILLPIFKTLVISVKLLKLGIPFLVLGVTRTFLA